MFLKRMLKGRVTKAQFLTIIQMFIYFCETTNKRKHQHIENKISVPIHPVKRRIIFRREYC